MRRNPPWSRNRSVSKGKTRRVQCARRQAKKNFTGRGSYELCQTLPIGR